MECWLSTNWLSCTREKNPKTDMHTVDIPFLWKVRLQIRKTIITQGSRSFGRVTLGNLFEGSPLFSETNINLASSSQRTLLEVGAVLPRNRRLSDLAGVTHGSA